MEVLGFTVEAKREGFCAGGQREAMRFMMRTKGLWVLAKGEVWVFYYTR